MAAELPLNVSRLSDLILLLDVLTAAGAVDGPSFTKRIKGGRSKHFLPTCAAKCAYHLTRYYQENRTTNGHFKIVQQLCQLLVVSLTDIGV